MAINPNDLPEPALKKFNELLGKIQTMYQSRGIMDADLTRVLATMELQPKLELLKNIYEQIPHEKSTEADDNKFKLELDALFSDLSEADRQAKEMGYLTSEQRKEQEEALKKLSEPQEKPTFTVSPELKLHYDNVVNHPGLKDKIKPEDALAVAEHAHNAGMTPGQITHALNIALRYSLDDQSLVKDIENVAVHLKTLLENHQDQAKAFDGLSQEEQQRADEFMFRQEMNVKRQDETNPNPNDVAAVIKLQRDPTSPLQGVDLGEAVDKYHSTKQQFERHYAEQNASNEINKQPVLSQEQISRAVDVATAYAMTRPAAEAVSTSGVGNAVAAAGVAPTAQAVSTGDIATAAVEVVRQGDSNQNGNDSYMMSSMEQQITTQKNAQNAQSIGNTVDTAMTDTNSAPDQASSHKSTPKLTPPPPPGAATGGSGGGGGGGGGA